MSPISDDVSFIKQEGQAPLHCQDRGVVETLYKRFGQAAIRKAQTLVVRLDIAQEIVQDVFIRLWKSQIEFENPKAAYAWIYRACHNAGVDYLRSATYRREAMPEVLPDMESPDASSVQQRLERIEELQMMMKGLKADESYIVMHHYVDGMTQEEVADLMKISRKTVNRALKRVAAKWANLRRGWHE